MGIIILKVKPEIVCVSFFLFSRNVKDKNVLFSFQIKEVASDQRTMSRFWNVDIREVRKLNRNKEEANQTQKNLISQ